MAALAAPTRAALRLQLLRGLATAPPIPPQKRKVRVLDQTPDPNLFEDHRRPWFFTLNKYGNLLIIPSMPLFL